MLSSESIVWPPHCKQGMEIREISQPALWAEFTGDGQVLPIQEALGAAASRDVDWIYRKCLRGINRQQPLLIKP